METKNKIKQVAHILRELSFLAVALSIIVYLFTPEIFSSEETAAVIYTVTASVLGSFFFLNAFSKTAVPYKWEKVHPELKTSALLQRRALQKVILILNNLIDIALMLTGLTVFIEIGINWEIFLIAALGLYIVSLVLRAKTPVIEDPSWEMVYPELALGSEVFETEIINQKS
jgi:hypothetical protein